MPFEIVKKRKKEEKKEEEREEKREITQKERERKESIASFVLIEPHITEKSTRLQKQNQYVFKVFKKATKNEIKKAVESLFGVHVESVRVINVPPKKKRLGRIEGKKSGYKKAIVKIKEGEKIEILPK